MRFDEKLIMLRKQRGLSQEQLADRLGVTRQSVSKWESGLALPELMKIITLSEIFDVSVDYLVKDYIEDEAGNGGDKESDSSAGGNSSGQIGYNNLKLEQTVDEIRSYMRGYEFTSKTKIAGIPLVSIRLSRRLGKGSVAKGIIAIGNVSVGVISIGLVSAGVFSFGCLALGVLALGAMAVGIAAFGAAALGILTVGSAAAGIYAGGVAVYGSEIAVGVAAWGKTVIGESTKGVHQLQYYDGIAESVIRNFLTEHHPGLWKPLLDFFTMIGMNIK